MMDPKKTDPWRKQSRMKRYKAVLTSPFTIVCALAILIMIRVFLIGPLVYGDISYFDTRYSKINFLYIWGEDRLGTNVRQSFNTWVEALRALIVQNDTLLYASKYLLPMLLIPVSYYFLLKKLGIKHRFTLIFVSLLPLFTPVVFGDFLNGQTFWVYLPLPWVFYFAMKIFYFHDFSVKTSLFLALTLFLSTAALPPIIVPAILTLILVAGSALLTKLHSLTPRLLLRYAASSAVAAGSFILMVFPYVLMTAAGQSAYVSSSLLSDYYHNYAHTTLLNTFRLAGNNGNGQSILEYNFNSFLNLWGYLMFALIIAGCIFAAKNRSAYRPIMIALLLPLLIIVGFMHLLSTNLDFGTTVFNSQWIVSTIRNPAKLYVILLPLITILAAYSLQSILTGLRWSWQRGAVIATMIIALIFYGWPVLRGDFGLFYHRKDQISRYKKDPTIASLNEYLAHTGQRDDRSLLIPSGHRDELNYQAVTPGLNVLRLEGSLPRTRELVSQLQTSFNDKNSYFFNYLETTGIKNIFLKQDKKAYEDSQFTLFPSKLPPAEAAHFLQTKLDKTAGGPAGLLEFTNSHQNSLLYAAEHIIGIEGNDTLKVKAPFLGKNTAVIDETNKVPAGWLTTYSAKSKLADNETVEQGKAQLYDQNLLLAEIFREQSGGKSTLVINILNPLTEKVSRSFRYNINPAAHIVMLNDHKLILNDQKKNITLRAGELNIRSGTMEAMSLSGDPSFENTIPPAGDASKAMPGEADIYTETSDDAADGEHSVLLGSRNHLAYAATPIPLDSSHQDYLLTFNHKNLQGKQPEYKLLWNKEGLAPSGSLSDAKDWQENEIFFTSPDHTESVTATLYFYTYAKNETSENLFDDLQLFKIHQADQFTLHLASYQPDYDLIDYTHHTTVAAEHNNLLKNASFEEKGLWGSVGDATIGAPGKASMKAVGNDDAADGDTSLQLESSNHTAYVAQKLAKFAPNTIYKLSFYYKHVSGLPPSFAIWQEGASIAAPAQKLSSASEWTYYETFFVPERNTNNLSLFFYSPSNGGKTINLFDNVRLETTSLVATYLIKNSEAERQPDNLLLDYQRINPTLLTATARRGQGMVVFNESYHPGWKLFVLPKDKTLTAAQKLLLTKPGEMFEAEHSVANGFANGWWIDPQKLPPHIRAADEYQIIFAYMPQHSFFRGLLISKAALVGTTVYIAWNWRRGRERQQIWRIR